MSTDLYEILEIQKDATPDQVRKAYKKRALQTHPDRVPPSDKTQAEERFRQVNNAYEVLIDPQKRESYNRHGVWPPPTEDPRHHHSQNSTRDRQFHPNIFTFTDPFELFESFFNHTNPFHDPFPFGHPRTFHDPFAPATFSFPMVGPFMPFDPSFGMSGPFQDIFPHNPFMPPMMGGSHFHSHGTRNGGRSASYPSASSHSANMVGSGRQWVSESHSISTINGLTTRVHERVDSSGNVHTTSTHPDGSQTYTINGIPQASGQIGAPPPSYAPRLTEHPRRSHHHHRRHNDYPQGRYDPHTTYRDHDGDFFPDYRDPRRPNI